jgi:hypothetical protein
MFIHLEWKYVDKNDVNVHFDCLTKLLASRATTNDEKSSITAVFLYELDGIFELCECIYLNF